VSVARQRLHSQLLAGNGPATPQAVVAHMLAVQAQDYLASLWAVGARMQSAVEADVERAIDERRIIRCWPLRGTLHYVAAEDARWLLDFLAPRVLARHRPRLEREFSIDAATLRKCRSLVSRALRDGEALTRGEIYALFENAGIATKGSRGLHILFALAHEQLICFGPRRGKQPTFVLLDEWLPPRRGALTREESLSELARRYLRGHGPAGAVDLAWWAGLTPREAKEALALAGDRDVPPSRTRRVHLLPAFDEYTVAYRDRGAVIEAALAKKVNAGGGMINAIVVIDGLVAGTWKRTLGGAKSVEVQVTPFRALTEREQRGIDSAITRYKRFLGG